MNRRAVGLLSVVVITPFVFAQTNTKLELSQEYIDVRGVRVRLGMTKSEITEKLGSQKLQNEPGQTEDFWLFGEKQEWPSSIEFKDGKVVYASQSWIGSDGDVTKALFGAVSTLNQQGYATCGILADTKRTPNLTAERVWINCGKKSILVQRLQDSKSAYQQVFERLGSPPTDPELP